MKTSFFTKKETGHTKIVKGRSLTCTSCKLYKNAESPKMQSYGKGRKGIICIGEAPGEIEDRRGKPWQGKTGRLLQRTLKEFGIDLFEDCISVNAVNCRPKNNASPTNFQIDCCRNVIVNQVIEEYQPTLILVLGKSALHSIIGDRWKNDLGGITKWRGFVIPDQDSKCWIAPVFHPSYVAREDENKAIMKIWKDDIQNALDHIEKSLTHRRYHKLEIKIIDDLEQLWEYKTDCIAFDYETTGIKPHDEGHKIICASVAINESTVYSFLIPDDRKRLRPFIRLLRDRSITKMAHNMKFEETWTREILRTKAIGWEWDSMIAAHILDNRPGITGLKFQTYINFGVIDYASEISPYLKAKDEKNANSINRIEELLRSDEGTKKLLTYCALDSIYEYRLAQIQKEIINYDYLPF